MAFYLLKCLAGAVARHGVKFVCHLVPGGEVLYDIAADAYQGYRERKQEGDLRAEVQALAQAPAEQVRQEVRAAVEAEAAHLSVADRQKIAAYLGQVPALIRRSLRRPSDPTGTTVPASLALRQPDDLLPFLPPRPPRFQPGDRPLPGVDWVLEESLGVGGFGEVWKARHAHLRSKPPVALKFCLDASAVAALRNEAGVLDRVMQHGRHPGIVPLLNTYLSATPPCLEYEYVEGGDLASLIQELHGQGKMTLALANRLLLRLAEIVASAHQAGIVHGDLKPANVLVRRGANGGIDLRVTDFGIGGLAAARAARETRQPTRSRQELLTEAVRGAYTPLYAAPEQMRRRPGESADPRDDMHALGVIWYQLVTGDLGMLSVPTDWREQLERRGLGKELLERLAACIAPKAADRPASAAALVVPSKVARAGGRFAWRKLAVGLALVGVALLVLFTVQALLPENVPSTTKEAPKGGIGEFNPQPDKKAGDVVENPLGMKFAWIPPGTFLMGSPKGEANRGADEIQHRVTLTKGFYLGVYEVTQKQWRAVMGKNPSSQKGDDLPVTDVSWEDCQEFCKKLGERDGRRYRLPTEAEWEYACRAGTASAYSSGDGEEALRKFGWYSGKRKDQPQPVGRLAPNAWGLYDMHGNVWEWCQDWYGPYGELKETDPFRVDKGSVGSRVLRGGSWFDSPGVCRAASRGRLAPASRYEILGLRVCFLLD